MKQIIRNLTLSIFLVLLFSPALSGQTSNDFVPAHFRIILATDASNFILVCDYGCDWSELKYRIEESDKKALVTSEGFSVYKNQSVDDESISTFGFTIAREDEMIVMDGLVGTAWLNQSFTLLDGEEQVIDEF